MDKEMDILQKIINGSKEFSMNGSILTLKSYYSGETIKLDLQCIDEEMLEQIIVTEDDEVDEDW
jgi:hypothetical protein